MRTVLWGWLGQDLDSEELAGLERLRADLDGELGERLTELLTDAEIAALAARRDHLAQVGQFPAPLGEMPAIPWPPF